MQFQAGAREMENVLTGIQKAFHHRDWVLQVCGSPRRENCDAATMRSTEFASLIIRYTTDELHECINLQLLGDVQVTTVRDVEASLGHGSDDLNRRKGRGRCDVRFDQTAKDFSDILMREWKYVIVDG
jgi:hypothetical protein